MPGTYRLELRGLPGHARTLFVVSALAGSLVGGGCSGGDGTLGGSSGAAGATTSAGGTATAGHAGASSDASSGTDAVGAAGQTSGGGPPQPDGGMAATAGANASAGTGTNGGSAGSGGQGGLGGGGLGGSGGGNAGHCPFGTTEFFLWSGTAPGSEGVTFTEKIQERSSDPAVHDRTITRVSRPSIFAYPASAPNGAAALIMPGGAYSLLAFDLEGVDIAKWLTSIGVTAYVLKYRLPTDYPQPWIALADAQRAIRLLRDNAHACGSDPARIGVVGFSAGGHLASQLETRPAASTSPSMDAIDKVDARPAFGLLMYPVISMDPSITHSGSKNNLLGSNPLSADVTLYSSEKQVTPSTPPTFIGVSKKDTGVDPQNSVVFDNALKAAQVPEELHLYNDGAHGTGIRKASGDMAQWPNQAAAWLSGLKLTAP